MTTARLVSVLSSGGVAILRTDTLYGIVAEANNHEAVERVFTIKARDRDKPLIVLIAKPEDAYDGAHIIEEHTDGITPTTIIVQSPSAPDWLQHSDSTVGYRVPVDGSLRALLEETGPLVAPSANPQGEAPARTVQAARRYFGNKIDRYLDGGEVPIDQAPSAIIRVSAEGTNRLR